MSCRVVSLGVAGVFGLATLAPALTWAGGPPPELPDFDAVPPDAAMGDGLRSVSSHRPEGEGTGVGVRAVVCPEGETTFGIDVSKWQGEIDWAAVANDGVAYAFVRVSDGLNFPDEFFVPNLAAARAQGIHTGAYQFFRPNQDPIAQADYLVDQLGELLPGDLPPVIDVEATGGLSPAQVATAVQSWIDRVESRTGVTPLIYTGKYFWQDNVQSYAFTDYPLWIAHYTTGCPNLPDPWNQWSFHQYTDAGSVAGVAGNVDSNDFNGSLAQLVDVTVGGGGSCGDGTCNVGETTESCLADCPPCGVIPPEGRDIDELDACFFAGGDPQYWRDVDTGIDDHHWWTYATASPTPANYGVWDLWFEAAGDYELWAHIPAGAADSTQARYQVRHDGIDDTVDLDQSGADGWVLLGTYAFAAEGDQRVRIDDNTGEDWELQRKLVVDALRVRNAEEPGTTSETGDPSGSSGTEESSGSDGDTGSDTTTGGETTGGSGSAGGGSGEVGTGETGPGLEDEGDDRGCGCASAPASPGAPLLWLVVWAWRSPRRRDRRAAR